MKALVVFEYPSLNGGEYSWFSKLPYLRTAGITIEALGESTGDLARLLEKHDVRLHPFAFRDSAGKRRTQESLRSELSQTIRSLAPDLVHANSLSTSRLLGPVIDSLSIPGLGHLRDIVGLSKKAIADVNQMTRLLAVSRATRDWHVDRGLTGDRVRVQYNGVDLARFRSPTGQGKLHQELGVPGTTRLIGTIGQLGLRKGTDVLLAAAAKVAEKVEDVHWVLVGERHSTKRESIEFCERLSEMATMEPLNGRVHFLGRRHDLPALLSDLHLVAHAARQEPLGRVLLEASAAGRAIVATRVGGTAEIFQGTEIEALLVDKDDPSQMSLRILSILNDDELHRRLCLAAKSRAESAFDAEVRGPELACHYYETSGVALPQRPKNL